MDSLRWFGGHATLLPDYTWPTARPAGVNVLGGRDHTPVWTHGDWPATQTHLTSTPWRTVIVLGRCDPDPDVLWSWAQRGVPADACLRFPGAYTVVESSAYGVTVYTDPGHVQPLYTTRMPDGMLLWGSSSLALAALAGAEVDQTWLRAHLTSTAETPPERSAFAGVVPVPPGVRMRLTSDGVHQETIALPTRQHDTDAGAPALRRALEGSLAAITSAQVAADCSGGLDSTSLALLLAARPAGRQLTAVTIHPRDVLTGGDLDYARHAVDSAPALRHLLCPLDDRHTPYSNLGLVPATDEPPPSTRAIARLDAELRLLAQRGVTDLVTGDGGDTLLGPQPGYLPELARPATALTFARHTLAWARLRRCAPGPLALDAWRRRGGPTDTEQVRLAMRLVARTARADAQVSEQLHGITLHNPFADPTVVEAALRVPGHLRATPASYKPVLREAMTDLLPRQVANRTTKGDFTPDQYRGLRANLTELHEMADGRLAARGLIDPARLRELLHRAAVGAPVSFAQLNPIIDAEIWLRALEFHPPAAAWADPSPIRTGSDLQETP